MKKFTSEARRAYEDMNHGMFSKSLAEFAIKNMKDSKDERVNTISLEDFKALLNRLGHKIEDKYMYTAWYLYNMAIADYKEALPTVEQKIAFVKETMFDPDCCPEAVLECFVAKMCIMGVPIYWENYL